jgi:CheY-like chemotaxis protein
VESEVGQGTAFTCHLPFTVIATRAGEKGGLPRAEAVSIRGVRVLLAEDVEINRALQEETLAAMGAVVQACADGAEALAALDTFRPDVILMDIQMPRKGGVETIGEIRTGRKMKIPAIAMTANARAQDIAAFRRAGFDDVIIKPFREADLAARIRSLVPVRPSAAKEPPPPEPAIPDYELDDLVRASHGNNGFVARMLKIFLSSGEGIITKAEASLAARNWEELAGHAHRLVPSCRQLSAFRLAEKLKLIEELCHDGPDEARIRSLVEGVRASFTALRAALEKEITRYEETQTPG